MGVINLSGKVLGKKKGSQGFAKHRERVYMNGVARENELNIDFLIIVIQRC